MRVIAKGLVVAGLAFGLSGVAALGRQLRAHPVPAEDAVLRTQGFYRVVRHPVYVGLLSGAAGVAALRGRPIGVAAFMGLLLILSSKASYEERALVARFGEAYERYCGEVPRGLPPAPWIGKSAYAMRHSHSAPVKCTVRLLQPTHRALKWRTVAFAVLRYANPTPAWHKVPPVSVAASEAGPV